MIVSPVLIMPANFRNDNGGIVPPYLQFPIVLPIMPPGYEEPDDKATLPVEPN